MHDSDPEFSQTRYASPGNRPPGASQDRLPVLVVLRGAQVGRRYLLNEDSLILGRRPDRADLVIPGDPQVSSVHCRIERGAQPGAWSLVDLSSTNGTIVGDQRIAAATLRDGDRIHLGDTVLKFCFHDELEDTFHRQVDHLMNVDDLTGLPVQRVYAQRYHDVLRECARARRALAVFMMDLDGLKKINDTNGHLFGARSIAESGKRVGAIIAAVNGVVSRFGGDEFSAFVPGLDLEAAKALGERMRAAIADAPVELHGRAVRPTMSVGVAVFPTDGQSAEALTRHADEALYRAKAAGRNRVSN